MIVSALVARGVAPVLAKIFTYVVLPLVLIGAAWFALDAWGDSRYRAGVDATDAAWKAASDKALKDAVAAGAVATKNELGRLIEHQAKVEDEKEAIDAALANGTSPVDALFPAADNGVR